MSVGTKTEWKVFFAFQLKPSVRHDFAPPAARSRGVVVFFLLGAERGVGVGNRRSGHSAP